MAENSEVNEKIEELRVLEGNLQGFMNQRQSVQMEVNEIDNALDELRDYEDDAYKVVSGIMLKTDKSAIVKELEEKKKVVGMKIEAMERQEKILENNANELKKEINILIAEGSKKK